MQHLRLLIDRQNLFNMTGMQNMLIVVTKGNLCTLVFKFSVLIKYTN